MSQRRQFSSCDACRASRIGCDAINGQGCCSNCTRRDRKCTFKWLEKRGGSRSARSSSRRTRQELLAANRRASENALGSDANARNDAAYRPRTVDLPNFYGENVIVRKQQALSLHYVLWDIFTTLFEPQLGLWIGNDCNPLKRLDTAPQTLISRLMVTLDKRPRRTVPRTVSRRYGFPDMLIDDHDDSAKVDGMLNQALISAVHAFSARWLPLVHFQRAGQSNTNDSVALKETLVRNLWQRALKAIVPALSRAAYRSILALYLFGTTPTFPENTERAMGDICFETGLRHIVQLKAKDEVEGRINRPPQRPTQHNSEETGAEHRSADELVHLEETAYWFGLVIDGSRSLTRCQPAIIIPATTLDTYAWQRIEQYANSRDLSTIYRTSKTLLDDYTVMRMIQHGSLSKTIIWKYISAAQAYLFYNIHVSNPQEKDFVSISATAFELVDQFESSFGPFLDQCARDLAFLSEKSRLSYFILSFHHHLGVLVLFDAVTQSHETHAADFNVNHTSYWLHHTRAIVNLINLVLRPADPNNSDGNSQGMMLKDPYPEHTRNGLARAADSVLDLYLWGHLPKPIAESMAATLFAGLTVLTPISYTAVESLQHLRERYRGHLTVKDRSLDSADNLNAAVVNLGSAITPDMLEEATVNQLGLAGEDPTLVDRTIQRYEFSEETMDFGSIDLSEIDFSEFIGQDWDFDDCFTDG